MPGPRRLVLVPAGCVLLLAAALPSATGVGRPPPETVVVRDGRTSVPAVDISRVRLDASWYWDSVQSVRVRVPQGFRPGHRLTAWFDLDGDATPDGHVTLQLRTPTRPHGTALRKVQEFRVGGGWSRGGKRVSCTTPEGDRPAAGRIRSGQRSVVLALDLWSCLRAPTPGAVDPGSWRAAVRVAKGGQADMAPSRRRWSAPVAGWGPCDPSGGRC